MPTTFPRTSVPGIPLWRDEAFIAKQEVLKDPSYCPTFDALFRSCVRELDNYHNGIFQEYVSIEFYQAVQVYNGSSSFLRFLIRRIRHSRTLRADHRYNKLLHSLSRGMIDSKEHENAVPGAPFAVIRKHHESVPIIRAMRLVASNRERSGPRVREDKSSRPLEAELGAIGSTFASMMEGVSSAARSLLDILLEIQASERGDRFLHYIEEAKEELRETYSDEAIETAFRELRGLVAA